jgi:hypothetical protein
MSRARSAKSRQSTLFTDNGNIRMDVFARHFLRADKVVENVREAKETLQKQYQEEQVSQKEAQFLLESRPSPKFTHRLRTQ